MGIRARYLTNPLTQDITLADAATLAASFAALQAQQIAVPMG
jgi:hypothetical protein